MYLFYQENLFIEFQDCTQTLFIQSFTETVFFGTLHKPWFLEDYDLGRRPLCFLRCLCLCFWPPSCQNVTFYSFCRPFLFTCRHRAKRGTSHLGTKKPAKPPMFWHLERHLEYQAWCNVFSHSHLLLLFLIMIDIGGSYRTKNSELQKVRLNNRNAGRWSWIG